MLKQQSTILQPDFQANPNQGSTKISHISISPKIKPLLLVHPKGEHLKATRLQVSYSKAVISYPRVQNFSFDQSQPLENIIKAHKTANQLFNVPSQANFSFHRFLMLARKYFTTRLVLGKSFFDFWWKNKKHRIFLRNLASFKNHIEFYLKLYYEDSLDAQLKYLQIFRSFRTISLNLDCYLASFRKSLLVLHLEKLRKLRELNLSVLSLKEEADEFVVKLSLALPQLRLLTKLYLSIFDTQILESSLLTLFKGLSALKYLTNLSLHFSGCNLISQDQNKTSFEDYFGDDCRIQKFSFTLFKNLDDKSLSQFSQILKKLPHLVALNFDFFESNSFTDHSFNGFISILNTLCSLCFLRLRFYDAKQTQKIVQSIAWALEHLKNLTRLDLYLRNFNSDDEQFLQLFGNLRLLKFLKFLAIRTGVCLDIKDDSLKALGKSLRETTLLQYLTLDFFKIRSITDNGAEALIRGIGDLISLRCLELDFSVNGNLTENTEKIFAEMLKNLASLWSIKLQFESCYNMGSFERLVSVLEKMKNIREVHLWLPRSALKNQRVKDLDTSKFTVIFMSKCG